MHIVFKGFFEDIDSFGSFQYNQEYADSRLSHRGEALSCTVPWTGSYELKSSNLDANINAPPDIMAVLRKKALKDVIGTTAFDYRNRKIFVCGLALDYCVLDTAVNASYCYIFCKI